MKKSLVIALCLAIGLFLMPSLAKAISPGYAGEDSVTAGTGINDTVHDLRRHNALLVGYKSAQPDYLDRLCIFCHAPHHAVRLNAAGTVGTGPLAPADYDYLPLWNHALTIQTFVPYNPGAQPIDGPKHAQSTDVGIFDKIGAASLLCLSCHDGSVAVNLYGNTNQDPRSYSEGTELMDAVLGEYLIGGDGYLANHHPIGFYYASVESPIDPDIIPADIATFDHDLDTQLGNFTVTGQETVSDHLYDGKMECATCHAVHNKGNSGEKLLYVSDQNSNLCFSCHDKGEKTLDGVTP